MEIVFDVVFVEIGVYCDILMLGVWFFLELNVLLIDYRSF